MVVQNFHWKYNQLSAVGQAGGCEAVPSSSCFTTAGRTSSGRRPWRLNLPQTSSPYCHTPRVARPIYSLDSFHPSSTFSRKTSVPPSNLEFSLCQSFCSMRKIWWKRGNGWMVRPWPTGSHPPPPLPPSGRTSKLSVPPPKKEKS